MNINNKSTIFVAMISNLNSFAMEGFDKEKSTLPNKEQSTLTNKEYTNEKLKQFTQTTNKFSQLNNLNNKLNNTDLNSSFELYEPKLVTLDSHFCKDYDDIITSFEGTDIGKEFEQTVKYFLDTWIQDIKSYVEMLSGTCNKEKINKYIKNKDYKQIAEDALKNFEIYGNLQQNKNYEELIAVLKVNAEDDFRKEYKLYDKIIFDIAKKLSIEKLDEVYRKIINAVRSGEEFIKNEKDEEYFIDKKLIINIRRLLRDSYFKELNKMRKKESKDRESNKIARLNKNAELLKFFKKSGAITIEELDKKLNEIIKLKEKNIKDEIDNINDNINIDIYNLEQIIDEFIEPFEYSAKNLVDNSTKYSLMRNRETDINGKIIFNFKKVGKVIGKEDVKNILNSLKLQIDNFIKVYEANLKQFSKSIINKRNLIYKQIETLNELKNTIEDRLKRNSNSIKNLIENIKNGVDQNYKIRSLGISLKLKKSSKSGHVEVYTTPLENAKNPGEQICNKERTSKIKDEIITIIKENNIGKTQKKFNSNKNIILNLPDYFLNQIGNILEDIKKAETKVKVDSIEKILKIQNLYVEINSQGVPINSKSFNYIIKFNKIDDLNEVIKIMSNIKDDLFERIKLIYGKDGINDYFKIYKEREDLSKYEEILNHKEILYSYSVSNKTLTKLKTIIGIMAGIKKKQLFLTKIKKLDEFIGELKKLNTKLKTFIEEKENNLNDNRIIEEKEDEKKDEIKLDEEVEQITKNENEDYIQYLLRISDFVTNK